ncbi:MAG: hypothetical protein DRJ40_11425 [Thermoprotei archaeon]|nr:MAG: hypothetical protein DRJ40_11425 [Thermoprotei archaeon]
MSALPEPSKSLLTKLASDFSNVEDLIRAIVDKWIEEKELHVLPDEEVERIREKLLRYIDEHRYEIERSLALCTRLTEKPRACLVREAFRVLDAVMSEVRKEYGRKILA